MQETINHENPRGLLELLVVGRRTTINVRTVPEICNVNVGIGLDTILTHQEKETTEETK